MLDTLLELDVLELLGWLVLVEELVGCEELAGGVVPPQEVKTIAAMTDAANTPETARRHCFFNFISDTLLFICDAFRRELFPVSYLFHFNVISVKNQDTQPILCRLSTKR